MMRGRLQALGKDQRGQVVRFGALLRWREGGPGNWTSTSLRCCQPWMEQFRLRMLRPSPVTGHRRALDPAGSGGCRRAVARATTVSKQTVPHFYLDMPVDMTAVVRHRRESAPRHSVTSYVVAACVLALTEHPDLNVSFDEDGLIKREEVSVGVAVATDQGLLVPVLSDLAGVGLSDIGDRLRQAAERARLRRLTSTDHGLRSMVVTNLGMFGVDRFHAIINQPDPFILAVGKTVEQVLAIDGEITIRPTAVLSLSADHRVVDGVTAARFLSSVAAHLQELEGRVWS